MRVTCSSLTTKTKTMMTRTTATSTRRRRPSLLIPVVVVAASALATSTSVPAFVVPRLHPSRASAHRIAGGCAAVDSSGARRTAAAAASFVLAAAAADGASSSFAVANATDASSLAAAAAAADDDDDDDEGGWVRDGLEAVHAVDVRAVVGPEEVLVYDTSLRDGTQGESISVSCDDKLKIASRLAKFGVDYIEGGWPGSNPKDAEFFSRAQTELDAKARSKLSAFGSTRRKGIDAKDDGQIRALIDSGAPSVCIVAKSHLWHVTDIIRATPEENIDMIRDSVSTLVQAGRRVFVDLEHFYDGYKHDSTYALECCRAACDAGAAALVLCDTNGGSMPWDVECTTRAVRDAISSDAVTIGIHAHNDCGMAVANSVVAVKAGAGMVQGTINGIGERTGNADLCSVVPSLALHVGSNMGAASANLGHITALSRFVDETLNRAPEASAPFVGASAFAHKGGLHVAAMERDPRSYQHVDPTLVGNEKRVLISELSGRQNILGKIRGLGVSGGDEADASERATAVLRRVKELESRGYTFEGAEASVELMILHSTGGYCPPFRVLDYTAQVYDSNLDSASRFLNVYRSKENERVAEEEGGGSRRTDEDEKLKDELRRYNGFGSMWGDYGEEAGRSPPSRATIKVRLPNLHAESDNDPFYHDRLEVSDGNGPVDALARALKRALVTSHPFLEHVELIDYKVRILDPESATAATTRVMIEFRDESKDDATWTTVSVDQNVISASLNALVDGFEYALIEHAESCLLCDDSF